MTPDFVNGLFEFMGASMNLMNVRRLWIDKKVAGVAVLPSVFFTSWGLWNLYYYPALDQWWSFAGGLAIVAVNAVWVSLALYYGGKNAKNGEGEADSRIRLDASGIREASREAHEGQEGR